MIHDSNSQKCFSALMGCSLQKHCLSFKSLSVIEKHTSLKVNEYRGCEAMDAKGTYFAVGQMADFYTWFAIYY